MFCSTIIPTVGRATLTRAVESVLAQELPSGALEVIVVNDAGQPLAPAGWQTDDRVRVVTTQRRERSAARNCGAAMARGRYLHFLDDDDWLAPGALNHLWLLSETSQADWLYGMTQLVDRDGKALIRLQHGLNGNCFVQVMAGEWIPLQSSLIDAEAFFRAGGFNPLISGPEDIDLLRRIALTGSLAETAHLAAHVTRGEEGSTTDYDAHAGASRWAREAILDRGGVFAALRASASGPAWQGRIVRIYLTSLVWNLGKGRGFTGLSRGLHGAAALAVSGKALLSGEFWRAIGSSYESTTFQRGFEAIETRI